MVEIIRPDPKSDFRADNASYRDNIDLAIPATLAVGEKERKVKVVKDNLENAQSSYEDAEQSATTPKGAKVADVAHAKDSAKNVRRAIIQLMHAVFKGVSDPEIASSLSLTARSQDLLLKINDKIGDNLNDVNAVYLYPLVRAAYDGDVAVDVLLEKFNAMKGKVHQQFLARIAEAIIEQHAEYGETEEEFKKIFDHKTMTGSTVRIDEDETQQRQQLFTEEEREQYSQLRKEFKDAIRDAVEKDPSIPTEKKEDEIKKLNSLVELAIKNGDVATVASLLGGNTDAANALIKYSAREVARVSDARHLLDEYNITSEDMRFFGVEHIMAHFDEYFEMKGGKWMPTETFQKEMLKYTYNVANKLLQRVSGNPDLEWDKNFSDMHEGGVMRVIRNKLFALAEDPDIRNRLGGSPEASLAFRDAIFRGVLEIDYEIDARRAMHEVRRFLFQTTPDKISDFLKGFPVSRFSFVMNSFDGVLIELAREQVLRDVSQRIRANGNQLPPDLFASFFRANEDVHERLGSPSPDYRRARKNFMDRLKKMRDDPTFVGRLEKTVLENRRLGKNDKRSEELLALVRNSGVETWRIERALALAQAICLVADQRLIEEMVTADPQPGFVGQHPILQYFGRVSRLERGRSDSGGPEPFYDTPVLQFLDIPLTEEQINRQHRRKHNPRKRWQTMHERWTRNPEDLMTEYVENVFGNIELKDGLKLKDLVRDFFSYSFLQKASWRLGALRKWYEKSFGEALGKDWHQTYKTLTTEVGVGARWLFDKDRVSAEIKDYVLRQKLGQDYDSRYPSFFIDAQWEKFSASTSLDRDRQLRLFSIKAGGETLTIEEFIAEKERTYRGMNFLALLERSPYDFMLTMSALDKEIMATKDVGGKKISSFEFYFDDGQPLSKAQKLEKERYLKVLKRRWGDNASHIEMVMKTWHDIYQYYDGNSEYEEKDKDGKVGLNHKKIQERVYFLMSSAAGNVKMLKKPEMDQGDIGIDDEARALGRIFLDEGLRGHFRKLEEIFADGSGNPKDKSYQAELGDRGFFYSLAVQWFEIEQRKILPNTNEMQLQPFFEEAAVVGEDVLSRVWSDPKTYFDAVGAGLTTLDQMLKQEAMGNSKPMDEFMQKITALAANEGNEGMYKLVYIVGFLRMKFMQEHHNARDLGIKLGPIPLPSLLTGNPFLQREHLAYSTLYTNRNAKTMSSEEIRLTIDDWVKKGWLPANGKYSAQWLEKALRVDKKTYIINEVIPPMITLLVLIYILTQLKQAYDAEFAEQKKAA